MYETVKIIEPIRALIDQCPFLEQYNITIDPIGYETFVNEQNIADQGLIGVEYAKIDLATISAFGVNTSRISRVFSFRFTQKKKADYPDISDFLTNFIEWLDMMQNQDKTPKFSYERKLDGSIEKFNNNQERMSAANASIIAENNGLSVFNADIYVTYFIKYESDGRCY